MKISNGGGRSIFLKLYLASKTSRDLSRYSETKKTRKQKKDMLKEEKQKNRKKKKRKILSGLGVPKNPSLGPKCGPRFRLTQIWDLKLHSTVQLTEITLH